MSKVKKTYYDISKILLTLAHYIILLGQRSNGKSYQAKKTVLEEVYKTGRKFIYLRRWLADIKQGRLNLILEICLLRR